MESKPVFCCCTATLFAGKKRDASQPVRYIPNVAWINSNQYLIVTPTKAERPIPAMFRPQGTVTFAGAVGFIP
jgi:hypothetical protein